MPALIRPRGRLDSYDAPDISVTQRQLKREGYRNDMDYARSIGNAYQVNQLGIVNDDIDMANSLGKIIANQPVEEAVGYTNFLKQIDEMAGSYENLKHGKIDKAPGKLLIQAEKNPDAVIKK